MTIATEQQLEEVLSRPSEADKRALRELGGDLLILGVAGKMGPSLAARARRAADEAGVKPRIIGVARFSDGTLRRQLEGAGIETIQADLLDPDQLAALPDVPNVLFMAGRKFGSTGDEPLTWAMNVLVPAMVARRYQQSRIVAFSSGNVYPFTPVASGGPTEDDPVGPVGEYAQSALGRERMFQYFSSRLGTPAVILRLNYAIDLRYGVLVDIGTKVLERRPIDLAMGYANVIWQGDANSVALRSFAHTKSPALMLNLTGPEVLSVRKVAEQFGRFFGVQPVFEGREAETALLNNAAQCARLFGNPQVSPDQMIEWIAGWLQGGGRLLNKPTHFEARDGKF
jgi:nucleoside-diphosphate-sugar epimerase